MCSRRRPQRREVEAATRCMRRITPMSAIYWISGVTRGRRLASGGETTVYEGDYRGRAVAIRKFHRPPGGDWESPAGRSAVMVRPVVLVPVPSLTVGPSPHTRAVSPSTGKLSHTGSCVMKTSFGSWGYTGLQKPAHL